MRVLPEKHHARWVRIPAAGVLLALAVLVTPPAVPQLAAQEYVNCPDETDPALTGLAGVVRDTIQGIIISGATVSVAWVDAQGPAPSGLHADGPSGGVCALRPPLRDQPHRSRRG
ncbi:hypothetical protein [Candidatus Palauibacter sp.]|uniref:hypothetical protein n=1 Tax=Candidatus Palauibacter sp. TaxID=3101350 RepID=UPI003B013687